MKIINPFDIFRPTFLEDVECYFDRHKKAGKSSPAPDPRDEFLRTVLRALRTRPGDWVIGTHTLNLGEDLAIWICNEALAKRSENLSIWKPVKMEIVDHELFHDILYEVKTIVGVRLTKASRVIDSKEKIGVWLHYKDLL